MIKLRSVCLAFIVLAIAVTPAVAQIASHRAIYRLSLADAKSSGIGAIEGAMYIDWHEACEGWTISQRMRFQIYDEEGQAIDNDISFSSWEAKSGLDYRFTLRSMRNGAVDEQVRGYAKLEGAGKGGKAVFSEPKETVLELPPGTVFPTQHSIELIERAKAGERVFARHVFDGATVDGALIINALIMRKIAAQRPSDPNIAADLVDRPSWRVRMAFFNLEEQTAEPEYETGVRLLDNGVGLDFLFDYRDFSIKADLEQLEALPKPRC